MEMFFNSSDIVTSRKNKDQQSKSKSVPKADSEHLHLYKPRWFTYEFKPADEFPWDRFAPLTWFFNQISIPCEECRDVDADSISQFLDQWKGAKEAIGIETNYYPFRSAPRVFALPAVESMVGFLLQVDAGAVIVISPIEMPWLGEPSRIEVFSELSAADEDLIDRGLL